jgi:hypothetical protein
VRAIMLLLGFWLASAGAQQPPAAGTSSTTAPARTAAACTTLGERCGSCGPVGQCLEHLDAHKPSRVCVNGGQCVQTGCGSDADCPPEQVCAGLGGVPACCAPCP